MLTYSELSVAYNNMLMSKHMLKTIKNLISNSFQMSYLEFNLSYQISIQ